MLAAFLAYFRSQSVPQRRAILRERFDAYKDHEAVRLLRESLPIDVRKAFDHFLDTATRSNWGSVNG